MMTSRVGHFHKSLKKELQELEKIIQQKKEDRLGSR